jgi:hypothetical protein
VPPPSQGPNKGQATLDLSRSQFEVQFGKLLLQDVKLVGAPNDKNPALTIAGKKKVSPPHHTTTMREQPQPLCVGRFARVPTRLICATVPAQQSTVVVHRVTFENNAKAVDISGDAKSQATFRCVGRPSVDASKCSLSLSTANLNNMLHI